MDLKNVVILLWDSLENFSSESTQRQLGSGNIYKEVINFNSLSEFEERVINNQKLASQDSRFIFCCHINFADFSGYFNLRNSTICKTYEVPEVIYLSSGDSLEVVTKLWDKYKIIEKVILYNELIDKIKLDEIKSFSLSSIDKRPNFDSDLMNLKNRSDKIFLSHSSKDKEIVVKFRDIILIGGIGYDINKIILTSDESNGFVAGINIPQNLRQILRNEIGLFIQFLSTNYSKSRTCLNEEGAAWCMLEDSMFISINLIENGKTFIKKSEKHIDLLNKDSLLNIYDDRKSFFGNKIRAAHLSNKVDEFLTVINS